MTTLADAADASRTSRRDWRPRAIVVAVWLTGVIGYAAILRQASGGKMALRVALLGALMTAVVPSVMAIIMWRAAERFPRLDRAPWTYAIVQIALGILFVLAWTGWEAFQIGIGKSNGSIGGVDPRTAILWQAFIGVLLYGFIAGAIFAVKSWISSRELAVASERAERLRAQAELASLRAHLEPHFLFNTLHSVVALMRTDLTLAERAVEELSALLGYVLHLDRSGVQLVTIEEEWRFTERYLWLERLRMGDRLTVVSELDDEILDAAIPPFTMQPIVENAIRHGLSPKRAGGRVSIRARMDSGSITVEIEDDGVGCAPRGVGSGGLGTRAVAQRLTAQFGATATMTIDSAIDAGCRVRLTFPVLAIDERQLEVAHAIQ